MLAFIREEDGEKLFCAFNMTDKPVTMAVPSGVMLAASGAPGIIAEPANGSLSFPGFGAYIGTVK